MRHLHNSTGQSGRPACVLPVSAVNNHAIITLEAIGRTPTPVNLNPIGVF
jgi:hypothetical protein